MSHTFEKYEDVPVWRRESHAPYMAAFGLWPLLAYFCRQGLYRDDNDSAEFVKNSHLWSGIFFCLSLAVVMLTEGAERLLPLELRYSLPAWCLHWLYTWMTINSVSGLLFGAAIHWLSRKSRHNQRAVLWSVLLAMFIMNAGRSEQEKESCYNPYSLGTSSVAECVATEEKRLSEKLALENAARDHGMDVNQYVSYVEKQKNEAAIKHGFSSYATYQESRKNIPAYTINFMSFESQRRNVAETNEFSQKNCKIQDKQFTDMVKSSAASVLVISKQQGSTNEEAVFSSMLVIAWSIPLIIHGEGFANSQVSVVTSHNNLPSYEMNKFTSSMNKVLEKKKETLDYRECIITAQIKNNLCVLREGLQLDDKGNEIVIHSEDRNAEEEKFICDRLFLDHMGNSGEIHK